MMLLRAVLTVLVIAGFIGGCGMTERKIDPSELKRTTHTTKENGDVIIDFAPGEFNQKVQLDIYSTCMAKVDEDKKRKHELQVLALQKGTAEVAWSIAMDNMVENITHEHGVTMRNIWGKGEQGICQPGTNMWDAIIAEAEAVAATQQVAIRTTGEVLSGVIPSYFRFKTNEVIAENAGDETSNNVKGNNNKTEQVKKEDRTDVHANTTGEASPPNVTVDKKKNSAAQEEKEEEGEGESGEEATKDTSTDVQ